MKRLNRIIPVSVFLLFLMTGVNGQIQSKNALTYSIGKGDSDDHEFSGTGYMLGVGYQLNVWKDRLFFNPKLTVGSYNSRQYFELPDEVFTNINLEVPLSFDLIRYKSFSVYVGAGGVLKYSYGLVGNGGNVGDMVNNSYYSQVWKYGVYTGCGISYNPPKSCFFFTFQPYNYYFFVNDKYDYFDAFSSIGFGIKLPNKPAR